MLQMQDIPYSFPILSRVILLATEKEVIEGSIILGQARNSFPGTDRIHPPPGTLLDNTHYSVRNIAVYNGFWFKCDLVPVPCYSVSYFAIFSKDVFEPSTSYFQVLLLNAVERPGGINNAS